MNGHIEDETTDPQAQLALDRLAEIHPEIFTVLENASLKARQFFPEEPVEFSLSFDSSLFSHLVRYYFIQDLPLDLLASLGYTLKKLPNTGIEIRGNGLVLRVWKGDDGELPPAGDSLRRIEYYQQQPPLFPEMFTVELAGEVRLAIVWDVDSDKCLDHLYLVCPSGIDDEWKPGLYHWRVKIPQPTPQVVAQPIFAEANEPDYLDIELPDAATATDV
jgi:hypothetical protein